jgi:hypothetical protein
MYYIAPTHVRWQVDGGDLCQDMILCFTGVDQPTTL